MQPIILQALAWIIPAVLLPLLALAGVKLTQFLSAKVKGEGLRNVLLRAEHAAELSVKSVGQTFVDGLKASGKFDDDAKNLAKSMAISQIKSFLGEKGLTTLAYVLGMKDIDIDAYLAAQVESKVSDSK